MQYAPIDRLGPVASEVIVYGVYGVGLLAWVLALWWFARRAAHRAKQSEEVSFDARAIAPGDGVYVGEVELAPGESGSPLMVTLQQHGKESAQKKGYSVTWTETARTLAARPFYLRLQGGSVRLRVEPGTHPQLIDTLEPAVRAQGAVTRTRSARLDPGEKVWVAGQLARGVDPLAFATPIEGEGGYRAAPVGHWVLSGGRGRLVASTRSLKEMATHEASAFRVGAKISAVLGVIFHLVVLDYHLLALRGVDETVTATRATSQYVPGSRGSRGRTHYSVTFHAHGHPAAHVEDEVSYGVWQGVLDGTRREILAVVDPNDAERAQLGGLAELGVSAMAGVLGWIVAGLTVLIQCGVSFWGSEWYEKKRGFQESESGRLHP